MENVSEFDRKSLPVFDPYRDVIPARPVVLCKDCKHCKQRHGYASTCDMSVKRVSYVDGRRELEFCESVNTNGVCEKYERKPQLPVVQPEKRSLVARVVFHDDFLPAFLCFAFGSIVTILTAGIFGFLVK